MKKQIYGIIIECREGNIVQQPDISVIVNAANAQLVPGGGVDGAIHRAAGSELAYESSKFAPIKPGEAVITSAYKLPNKYVIHCLGPVYGKDYPADILLGNCYRNALEFAETYCVESIAFPAISTGAFAYPMEDAARVALGAVIEAAGKFQKVKLVRFVLYKREHLKVHEKVFSELTKKIKA
ncbi:MAG: macro domain-containing protein [Candidatus Omnitrophica bacterium]|nr:macro domain-containing protein [Candidatus Omnitrophota bacterium]